MKTSSIIFVSNIPFDATQSQITEHLEKVGAIKSFKFVFDKKSGNHKGQAYVIYGHIQFAESAVRNLNKKEFKGRILNISLIPVDDESFQSHFKDIDYFLNLGGFPFDKSVDSFCKKIDVKTKKELIREMKYLALVDMETFKRFLAKNVLFAQVILKILYEAKHVNDKNTKTLLNYELNCSESKSTNLQHLFLLREVPCFIEEAKINQQIQKILGGYSRFWIRPLYSPSYLTRTGDFVVEVCDDEKAQFLSTLEYIIVEGAYLKVDIEFRFEKPQTNDYVVRKFQNNKNNNNKRNNRQTGSLENLVHGIKDVFEENKSVLNEEMKDYFTEIIKSLEENN